jgi:hypothetical protein
MVGRDWLRWAPVAGLVWVALVIVSVILTADSPGDKDSASEFVSYFSDDDNQTKIQIAGVLAGIGGLAFLWFLAGLRDVLTREEGLWGSGASTAFAGGIAFVALLWVAVAAGTAYASAADFYDAFRVDLPSVQTAMALSALSFWSLGFASVAAAVMIAAASMTVLRTGVLPRWFGWVGIALAVLSFLAVAFLPPLAPLVWVLIASIALLMKPRPAAGTTAPA